MGIVVTGRAQSDQASKPRLGKLSRVTIQAEEVARVGRGELEEDEAI